MAVAWQFGRWQGAYPFAFLSGDSANIAGFAAALDHPGNFTGDAILSDPANFRFYQTIHLPLIRALTKITGDYGTSFIWLLGWHVLVQAVGFYILGRILFHRRYWAALYAIMTLVPVQLNLEFWGAWSDPLPRFSFQALLPYLLAAALRWRSSPIAWPWLMAAAGVLVYVHPVSAPGWGLALWLGFVWGAPAAWSYQKKMTV
ncbi:MAG: hypothetical protein Q7S23_01825, partial [bacterium]|nr:hypothetical protein [bacterium]